MTQKGKVILCSLAVYLAQAKGLTSAEEARAAEVQNDMKSTVLSKCHVEAESGSLSEQCQELLNSDCGEGKTFIQSCEIVAGSQLAKDSESFKRKRLNKEKCTIANRAWNETQERCMRLCKHPRKEYRFIRRKYRCFRRDPNKRRNERKICAQNKKWDKVSRRCVLKEQKIQIKRRSWCKMGKNYRTIEGSKSKRKRSYVKHCQTRAFEGPQCNECVIISKNECTELGRIWKTDDRWCVKRQSRTCKKVTRALDEGRMSEKRTRQYLNYYEKKCVKGCSRCTEDCKEADKNVYDALGECRIPTVRDQLVYDLENVDRALQ